MRSALARLAQLPEDALHYAVGKARGWAVSRRLAAAGRAPRLRASAVRELEQRWGRLAQGQQADGAGPTAAERLLLRQIREATAAANRNNVTRTAAYLAVYERCPELHWALLAHLVSRNGGWNMTDLAGELLPALLDAPQRAAVFAMLERANALIFGDAYPQLLLYEAALSRGRCLAHLLPDLGVSRFMGPVWEQFWRLRDPVPLALALIVNEQHFIEGRVVRNAAFRHEVLDQPFFALQGPAQLNLVLFPYGEPDGRLRLAGLVLEDFSDLSERIGFGKRLYALLFGVPAVHAGALAFARRMPHTGSRADYAPRLFRAARPPAAPAAPADRIHRGRLRRGAALLCSPPLCAAWPDRPVATAEPGDWFADAPSVVRHMRGVRRPHSYELTNEYGFALNKLETAADAARRLKRPPD
ncbi:DUF2515 family protein [Paenibacillus sp. IB182496]|uniref:DUF2515 family protein n=2 Tax=Paenibacillus sabuli TaxID=2772509 RepID=A0A927BVJ4_9BACL|nr:DUF2515 family protein [Paenibacillus sabuli]